MAREYRTYRTVEDAARDQNARTAAGMSREHRENPGKHVERLRSTRALFCPQCSEHLNADGSLVDGGRSV